MLSVTVRSGVKEKLTNKVEFEYDWDIHYQ